MTNRFQMFAFSVNTKPILWAFSKVCVFIDFDPSTRHRYCCVFKSFHFGDHFRKFAFSSKTIHRFHRFGRDKSDVAATKCRTHIPSPRVTCTCDMSLRQGQSGVQYNKIYFTEAKISFALSSRLVPWSQRFSFAAKRISIGCIPTGVQGVYSTLNERRLSENETM